MIKVENINVWGFEHAIRGMRNPMNSWDKSDSVFTHQPSEFTDSGCIVGETDLDLMRRLYKAGSEHRKYLRQIFVSMDITAPTYWNAEFDTYKIGVTRNSCSFMHKGISKPFEIKDFSVCDERLYEILSPLEKKHYDLYYPYETDDFRTYVGENGRKYRVYKNGKVVAEEFKYTDTMGRNRILEEKQCIPSVTNSGYYEINVGGVNGKKWQLHRLIAHMWIENPSGLTTVNHKDGNKGNNCVENLEWMSLDENIKNGFERGLYENGKSLHARYRKWKNAHSIMDPHKNKAVLDDHVDNKMTCRELAEKYNISIKQANSIISRNRLEYSNLFLICYTYENIINTLNALRDLYLQTKDEKIFQQIRCLLPCGYNQKYTVTMNYENVFNMIHQRKHHRLSEWREFVGILEDLPYVKEVMNIE